MIGYNWMQQDGRALRNARKSKAILPEGWHRITPAKPTTYCHYSNPASQGALICETRGFPHAYDPNVHDLHCAYSDRIAGWNYERFKRACAIAGTGDQGWNERLPNLSEDRLREFARVALNLSADPVHVRVVHHFNVSNGYSCPTVEAIVANGGAA